MKVEVVILAGGLGTRLRPFTITVPKPLLPLSDRPIVEVVLEQLVADGFRNACISLGYMAPLFQAFFGDGSRLGMSIRYVVEERPLGTAGALTLVSDLADDFLVLNGDTLTDLSYAELLGEHRRSGAAATIFCHRVDEQVDYGVIEFDASSSLTNYSEKPIRSYYVSTGIYALSRSALDLTKIGERLDMPDLLRSLKADGRVVNCFRQDGAYWKDIGRFDHYESASQDFQSSPERFLAKRHDRISSTE